MENHRTYKTRISDLGKGELLKIQNASGTQKEAAIENQHGNEYRLKVFIASAEGKIRYFI